MSQFRPSPLFRLANRFVVSLVRLGIPMGMGNTRMILLTVAGRRSGVERTTPVSVAPFGEGWLLVAVYGVCDWSLNLEAAGRATITGSRKSTPVSAKRIGPSEAGPILRDAMLGAPAMVRRMTAPYFTAEAESSDSAWERESIDHPVFLLTSQLPASPTAQ